MDRIIKSKMQQKRGTSAEIASSTEVLLEGEIVYDTTNKKIKVGDGKTQIKNLPYLKGDGDFLPLTGNRTITGPVRINYEPGSEAEALDVQGIAAFNNSRFLQDHIEFHENVIFSLGGTLDMNYVPDVLDGKIINVQDPTSAQDVATKNYVDSDIKTLENKITGQLGPYCQ